MKNKRRTVYIKKRFQATFAIKFLAIIVAEALLAAGILVYISMGTMVAGYRGSEIVIAPTRDYFFPTALLANLVIIAITAAAGFVVLLFVSHRIAGPLYRFEKSLDELAEGDLTHRSRLRNADELKPFAERLNAFSEKMESSVGRIKRESASLGQTLAQMRSVVEEDKAMTAKLDILVSDAIDRLGALDRAAGFFKTSRD
ncbi:MAG: methyl-accepting chemotaxis protein [Deltaproteobacteria bacterium]|nr:methyl-accepting chemotaxis protein [Deltaproteobacteria bacterium]